MNTSFRFVCASSALALLASAALSNNVTILGSPTSYPTIQAAVDAAIDGDVLLVDPGTYAGFTIDDKSLSVFAQAGGSVKTNTKVIVRNLAGSRRVVLSTIKMTGQDNSSSTLPGIPALQLDNDAGHVRLEGCTMTGGKLYTGEYDYSPTPSGHGVQVTSCSRVMLVQCTLRGGNGGPVGGEGEHPGGDALAATGSTVAIYDCSLRGGTGTEESWPTGGKGGAGARITDYGLFSSGSTIEGGRGGGGDYIGCSTSGDGGDGLVLETAQAQVLDTPITAGLEGSYYTCTPGVPGTAIVNNGGVYNVLSGARRKLVPPALNRMTDNSIQPFGIEGQPGDSVWLFRADRPIFRFVQSYAGVLAVPLPWRLSTTPRVVLDASGTAAIGLQLGDLTGPEPGWIWYLQALVVDTTGATFVTSPVALLVENT